MRHAAETKDALKEEEEEETKEDEENENERISRTNAYPGASNTIGSIHQRQWFLTLDRVSSGFISRPHPGSSDADTHPNKSNHQGIPGRWIRKPPTNQEGKKKKRKEKEGYNGFEPFYVYGPSRERSVVTGRTGEEVMIDEGIRSWVGRKGWRAVLE